MQQAQRWRRAVVLGDAIVVVVIVIGGVTVGVDDDDRDAVAQRERKRDLEGVSVARLGPRVAVAAAQRTGSQQVVVQVAAVFVVVGVVVVSGCVIVFGGVVVVVRYNGEPHGGHSCVRVCDIVADQRRRGCSRLITL